MNDEFLTRLREAPRAEFAEALYERISRQSQPHFSWKVVNKLTFRNAAVMFVLLFLVAACVYAVVAKRWNQVGEIWVDVQSDPKNPSFVIQSSFMLGDPAESMKVANLAEAKTNLKFEFAFPSWAPEGFALGNEMYISPWSDKTLLAFWESQDGGNPIQIVLNYRWFGVAGANQYESVTTQPVVPGSFEEVEVQGHPAVLVRGDWNWFDQVVAGGEATELEWDEQNGLSLYWTEEDVAYLLRTYNPDVSAEDLIKMAESAR